MIKKNYTAIVALGSNLGNSIQIVQDAIFDLATCPYMRVIQSSSLYRTTPVGYSQQNDFINAVCEINTTSGPLAFLEQLQIIEKKYQRIRTIRNGPRTLDLDLIDFEHYVWDTEELILPHPRAHYRSFVMVPFAEILPNYFFNQSTVCAWKEQLGVKGVQRLIRAR
ncbi:MAG: 2-amino-4-hydroxy-6-hydroxymethyldihydropteridine diphosphokinase [Neisseriaceae bacterium]